MSTQLTTPTPVYSWDKPRSPNRTGAKKGNQLTTFILIALVILAASGLWRAIHTAPSVPMTKVLTTVKDLPAGTRLGFMAVKYMDIPKKLASSDMVTSLSVIDGRVARTFLTANEPLTADQFFESRQGVAGSLENDERAITFHLSGDALVDHSIQPDDRVDVLAVSTHNGQKFTKTISQDIRVIMSAPKEQTLERRSSAAVDDITLAVIPAVGEAITEAYETGKLRLVLRNRLARNVQKLNGSTPDDLLPASAFGKVASVAAVDTKAKIAQKKNEDALPPPPPLANFLKQAPQLPETVFGPAQWCVEMLMGSKKEFIDVGER